MSVFLVNPSDVSFVTAIVTPRWLYVLAAATPGGYGDPVVIDAPAQDLQDAACHRAHVASQR